MLAAGHDRSLNAFASGGGDPFGVEYGERHDVVSYTDRERARCKRPAHLA